MASKPGGCWPRAANFEFSRFDQTFNLKPKLTTIPEQVFFRLHNLVGCNFIPICRSVFDGRRSKDLLGLLATNFYVGGIASSCLNINGGNIKMTKAKGKFKAHFGTSL